MPSEMKVNKISPASGTAITLGDSGDTFTVPSGATIANSGTATGFLADDAVTTAKILNSNVTTAKIADNAVTLAKMAGGTDGQIITYDASGDPVAVGPGTDGQVLTSTGAGSPPAFEALPAGGYTELGISLTNNGGDRTIGSIPAGVKTLMIVLSAVSNTGVAELQLLLGDAGGIETSGYLSGNHRLDSTTLTSYHDTGHFMLVLGGGGADPYSGIIHLTRSGSGANVWSCTWQVYASTAPSKSWGVGSKTLSAELTQIQLNTTGGFDSGSWNAYYQ